MNKLIKLSDSHYIIVDDSIDIEENCYCFKDGRIRHVSYLGQDNGDVITHSTEPIESNNLYRRYEFINIKPLSLSEVEEAIYGYSVEKMAEKYADFSNDYIPIAFGDRFNETSKKDYIQGFKAHQELVEDTVFTVEDMKNAFKAGQKYGEDNSCNAEIELNDNEEQYIQSLLPKTEWNIIIDETNKITAI